VRYEGKLVPVFARRAEALPDLDAGGPLVAALESRDNPLSTDATGPRAARRLDPLDRAIAEELRASVVVPVRSSDRLEALLCFGPKRSGDIYTYTDITWLAAIADKIASQIQRLDDAERLREGRELQDALRSWVPGSVAERIEARLPLDASEREVTVLFVDIRGYTSYSERREPSEVFSMVSRYTELVSRIVRDYRGTVVEFSGDGMMAVFGAPEDLPQKEGAAVAVAEEILSAMRSLSGEGPSLRVGIGIATGPAFVGSIRSADRMIWSAIGNTTNLAARLQSLARDLEASIVIDEATRARTGAFGAALERHAGVRIRGLSEPQDVFAKPLGA
jgi:class 3 adenylate cyclase